MDRSKPLLNVHVPFETYRGIENIAPVTGLFQNELGISQTTLWQIFRKEITLHPYKIKLTQELKCLHHFKRRTFSNGVLLKFEEHLIEKSSSTMKLIVGLMVLSINKIPKSSSNPFGLIPYYYNHKKWCDVNFMTEV